MSLSLARAFRLDSTSCIAFVGAGGKTTALFQLARQLPGPVIVTATSHLGAWQFKFADRHISTQSPSPIEELEHGLHGVILITGDVKEDRSTPVNDSLLRWLHQFCSDRAIPLLIEADGSRQKPLKAWAEHEPAIPDFVSHVVQVVGLSGIGQTLTEENVHRPEIFSRLSGLIQEEKISAEAVTRVLIHPQGGLKNLPSSARRMVLLNQADTPESQAIANGMVQPLLQTFDSVIITNLMNEKIHAVHERIAGIVLAAGESTRYGQPKQLLDWHGVPFVRAVAEKALEAGLFPVVIVTGANTEKIESAVNDLNVKIEHNTEWKSGQGSSIRAGTLSILPPPPFGQKGVGGAIFLLVDQPQITISVLRALVEKHAEELYPIVAPMVMDQRANPVLFDSSTFPDLVSIEGDQGGRAIFHKHRVEYLRWHDDRLLLDVDTPAMYQRLISDETL